MEEWFQETKAVDLKTWYESEFNRNRTPGRIGLPPSAMRAIKSVAGADEIKQVKLVNQLISALGQSFIDLVVHKKPILKTVPFLLLEEADRETLRELIGEEIQNALKNNELFQLRNGSSISTGGVSINRATTDWVFTFDQFSIKGKVLLQNASLDAYEWISGGQNEIYRLLQSGDVQIIGKTDDWANIPSVVWEGSN